MATEPLPVTAGGAIFLRLHELGVDRVFANSGTDFPPIIEGLADAEANGHPVPKAVAVPHEHVAMGMAHGHYFATGKPAAVILHTNVGLANGAIGAINAATDHVPMIIMSGRTPTVESGRFGARTVPIGWGQEMRDQAALVREACKWDYEVRFPEQIPELLDRAFAIATSTPKGPVYLSLPREVLCEPCPTAALARPPGMAASVIAASPDSDSIIAAANLLTSAKRPLIIAQRGAGTQAGFDTLASIVELHSIPVCQYWAVATAISSKHPMYVGDDPVEYLAEADVVLVIDSLAPWSPDVHSLPESCQVIQLGPNPLYSRFPVRNFRSTLSITTETGAGLEALSVALGKLGPPPDRTQRRALIDERNARRKDAERGSAAPLEAQTMTKSFVSFCIANAIVGHKATVVSELGAPFALLGLTEHNSWRQEPHSGGLGWGLPCALGIKDADPDRLVIATVGDGSYIFANPVAAHHVAEVYEIALLTVILNNAGYGAVRQSVTGLYPNGYASKSGSMPLTELSPSPDFRSVAESCRAWAWTVTSAADLPGALTRAIEQVQVHQRQAVLDVRIV